MDEQKKILVSACLLGICCRYDGRSKPSQEVLAQIGFKNNFIPICPEQWGGLSTPRVPCEIVGGDGADVWRMHAKVCDCQGQDYSSAYRKGAEEVLRIAKVFQATEAWLMSKSPSCGCGQIYDGSFSGRLHNGDGVCTALLKQHGLAVRSIKV